MDIIEKFTSWLNNQRFIAYKHESLHGMVFHCNQDRTLYVPTPSLDQMVGSALSIAMENALEYSSSPHVFLAKILI